jgi:hypothetical protein
MEDDNSSKSDDHNKEKVDSQKEDQSWPDLQIAKGFHSVDTIEEVLRLWSHSKRTTLLSLPSNVELYLRWDLNLDFKKKYF